MKAVWAVLLLGCSDPKMTSDATLGGEGSGGGLCYGSTAATRVCLATAPTSERIFGGVTLDTDSTACETVASGPPGCVMAYTKITATGLDRATGSKPLILVATETFSLVPTAVLSAASRAGNDPGAGADPNDCASPAAATGKAGGAGGSFGGAGGQGGSDGAGTTGATPAASATPAAIRGG